MPEPRPAAQYLRMSTDQQRYSLANQAAVIASYAQANGYTVVRSYEDAGRSGVTARGRDGLKSLLSDVISGQAPFRTVLVLDVSRWGRFQNPDEAAHYEFLCRNAGVRVFYCAETFEPGATGCIVKQLKRVMAGEYSRELSETSRYGKRRQALKGFALGGRPPYGFGRRVVNADGSDGPLLRAGERKTRPEQNVRYVWGSSEEVEAVRRIFRLYVRERLGAGAVARQLNADGQLRRGEPWSPQRVKAVIGCDLVTGDLAFNKTLHRLDQPVRRLPRAEWRRSPACPPMVTVAEFRAAQALRRGRAPPQKTDAEMLADLEQLLAVEGRLSAFVIRNSPAVVSIDRYRRRFGGLAGAYRRIGYTPQPRGAVLNRRGESMTRAEVLEGLRRLLGEHGRVSARLVQSDPRLPPQSQFRRLFGGFPQAYAAAGLRLTRTSQVNGASARAGREPERSTAGA